MRAKSDRRVLAEQLRREQGLSYREIAQLTGISKSTLSSWLRYIDLTPQQVTRIQQRLQDNRASFAARAWMINRERHAQARQKAFQDGANLVEQLPKDPAVDELALAMLYLGEGTKRENRVQLASTRPEIIRYYLRALLKLYHISPEQISFRLNLVEAARAKEDDLLSWWASILNVRRELFQKTQFDARSNAKKVTEDYRGVCTVTYNDTYVQQRIIGLADTYIQSMYSS